MKAFIHTLADVQSDQIGDGTRIWQFSVVLKGARIGKNCNICSNTLLEGDVIVGDNCTIKSGVQLYDGVRCGNNVFIGPNATFTNDHFPRSKNPDWRIERITLEDGASVGANATILPGVTLGAGCMVGAGAVVTKNVPAGVTVVGNPAFILERKK